MQANNSFHFSVMNFLLQFVFTSGYWVIPYESTEKNMTLLEFLKDVFFLQVFKNKIFSIIFNYSFFKSKVLYLLSQVKTTINFYIYMYLKDTFVVLQLYIFQVFFSLFWSPRQPRISKFRPASLLQLFQPSHDFNLKKKLRFGCFKVWFGMKATKIGYFGHLNFLFRH